MYGQEEHTVVIGNVDSSSIGRAFDCDSKGCEFDSRLSTQRRDNRMSKEGRLLLLLLLIAIVIGFIGGKVLSIKYLHGHDSEVGILK